MARHIRVFVSYARGDRPAVLPLLQALEQAGVEILDPHAELIPMENPCLKIGRALESANAMLTVVSPSFARSELCQEEVAFALATGRYATRVVSVFLQDEVEPEPWFLSNLPHIKYIDDAPTLAKEIRTLLPSSSH